MITINNLEHLAIVRHGESYEDTGDLTSYGKLDANSAGYYLKSILGNGKDISLVSSPAKRARETAQIIANKLKVPKIEIADYLYTNKFEEGIEYSSRVGLDLDCEKVNDLLNSHKESRGLILVGHLELSIFPNYFTKIELRNQG